MGWLIAVALIIIVVLLVVSWLKSSADRDKKTTKAIAEELEKRKHE